MRVTGAWEEVPKILSQSRLEAYRQGLDRELKDCFSGRDGFLYNLLQYQLGWVDQQGAPDVRPAEGSFHSLLALAAGEAITGDFDAALPVAAAVELLHNFSIVHGDVQAGRVDAQSRPSIWWVWGPSQAINAGDGFHAMARVAAMRMLDGGVATDIVLEVTELLDHACLSMCEGQYTDLGFQERLLVTIGEYDDMIARKTGALTRFSAAGGALAAGGDSDAASLYGEIGLKLGMAWQIVQDLADFWGRDGNAMTASNTLNKKKSLPLIYTLDHCSNSGRREIGSAYMKRVLDPADISRVVELMEEVGAREYSIQRAGTLVSEALGSLDEAHVPEQRKTGFRELASLAQESTSTEAENGVSRAGA